MLIGFKTSRGFLGLPWTSEEARKTGGPEAERTRGRGVRDQALARGRKRRRRDGEL